MENTENVVVFSTEETQENAFENYRHTIVTTMGYLLGVPESYLNDPKWFDLVTYEQLKNNEHATIIRHLSILRTQLLQNYSQISQIKTSTFTPLENMPELLSSESILYLRERGIETASVCSNPNVTFNIAYINQYILDNIDKAKPLFPDWLKFEYIRPLFLMSGCYAGKGGSAIKQKSTQQSVHKKIHTTRSAYLEQKNMYPFRMYVAWPHAFRETDGNVLFNDAKFLKLLYAANRDTFLATEYVIDAKAAEKESIYDFVEEATNVSVFVDCENVDPFHFAATVLNLDEANLSKIKKIFLYDDVHTSTAWDYIKSIIKIPIETTQIDRILENKSLVDHMLTAGVCREFYQNNTESIILVSSDSDFWGVISSLPSAKFFVLNERDKTSFAIISKLNEKEIRHCYMDNFALDKVQEFKTTVLRNGLLKRIEKFNETGTFEILDVDELLKSIFYDANVTGASAQVEKEKATFFNKYLKHGLLIKPVEQDGKLVLKMEIHKIK